MQGKTNTIAKGKTKIMKNNFPACFQLFSYFRTHDEEKQGKVLKGNIRTVPLQGRERECKTKKIKRERKQYIFNCKRIISRSQERGKERRRCQGRERESSREEK